VRWPEFDALQMVNILWERGDVAASMNLEDLFDQLAKRHDIAIFCSFLMDNFNGEGCSILRLVACSVSAGGVRACPPRRAKEHIFPS